MSEALTASAPLKMPGKAITLFIWLGKSERPVPTINAPAAFASSGIISGVGLAIAKSIGLSFMDLTISAVTSFGLETPTKASAPLSASAREPWSLFLFVTLAISA